MNNTHNPNIPDLRLEVGKGLTLAWDVMLYGQPNEENVRKFLARFREKSDCLEHGTKKVVDQNCGEVLLEIEE